jgi:hypothetical protein
LKKERAALKPSARETASKWPTPAETDEEASKQPDERQEKRHLTKTRKAWKHHPSQIEDTGADSNAARIDRGNRR